MFDKTDYIAPGINIENCEKLISFLEQETKGDTFKFDMTWPFVQTGCGTAGCIAGACTALTSGVEFQDWVSEAWNAAAFIGIETRRMVPYEHPLFDPDLAPADCTPAEAIEAIRRVMRGEFPWDEEALSSHRRICRERGISRLY